MVSKDKYNLFRPKKSKTKKLVANCTNFFSKIIIKNKHFSVKEGICAEVPMLAIPLYAEQPSTADSIVKQNIGRSIHKLRVTKDEMLEQVNEV